MQGDTGGGVSSYSAIFLKAYQRRRAEADNNKQQRFLGAWRSYRRPFPIKRRPVAFVLSFPVVHST